MSQPSPQHTMHMVNSYVPGSGADLGPEETALLERRERVLGAPYRLFYQRPVHLVRGEGTVLYGADGTEYLDAYNNVPVVGHSNPRVRAAVDAQLGRLNTHTRYLTEEVVSYAERLTALFPAGLDQAIFACTGSEAIDLALRIAAHATGRSGILVTRHAYHGTTRAAAEISPSLGPNNPVPGNVALIDAPDALKDDPADAQDAFADRIEDAIEQLRSRGHEPAALVVDSIMSSDGLRPAPSAHLSRAAETIRAHGGLYIADEVQPGFGRTGDWWGFEAYGLRPDLAVLGKPMGNGLPISAVIGGPDLFEPFGRQVRYFNTFGGNPVSIAAATAVLDELEDRALPAHADRLGGWLRDELQRQTAADDGVAQVRGAGLFLAVELVTAASRSGGAPDAGRAARAVNHLRENRILISASGAHGNVLKIRPPLVLGESQAERLAEGVAEALRATRR
ncbi:aspartate aminotransferase family protein [Sediminivirga luteola]|uniref:Aspartate aminotransferase family protein n=1 Tax=Sediminivirga luteola TaxID=1774748 RepID=A0A8J2TXF4_9MICO|nr:aspartate aminotransferase family protein [Sediminivirga luteola]GGA12483.1 aspartate aminotransferase family protein [Sediminivirga luteola]